MYDIKKKRKLSSILKQLVYCRVSFIHKSSSNTCSNKRYRRIVAGIKPIAEAANYSIQLRIRTTHT